MLKNLSFLALASAFTLTGCVLSIGDDVADDEVGTETETTTETTTDTETETTADTGTTDTTDTAETEVGETAETETADTTDTGTMNMCGWDGGSSYYDCGFEGEDPSGTFPIGCPDGLVEGEACGAVTGEGCCDANGDLWYCGQGDAGLVFTSCAG